jgi:hypothetical protein
LRAFPFSKTSLLFQMVSLKEKVKDHLGFLKTGLAGLAGVTGKNPVQDFVLGGMESIFFKIGLRVAQEPIL